MREIAGKPDVKNKQLEIFTEIIFIDNLQVQIILVTKPEL